MNQFPKLGLVLVAIATLSACGNYRSIVLYEPSTTFKAAKFVPGDGCTAPSFRFGSVSNTSKAMVFLDVSNAADDPRLNLSVTTEGTSSFNFLKDELIISEAGHNTSTSVKMNSFKFATGGGYFSKREFGPSDAFVGPPRSSFRPYYPDSAYEKTQWSFSSQVALPISREDRFSVQIPSATIDGEMLSFPLVTFQRRELSYRVLCLK